MSDTASPIVANYVRSGERPDLRASAIMTALAQAVENAGISLSELARRLGTSRQNVSRWASGAVQLPKEQALRAAEILQVPAHVLILGVDISSFSQPPEAAPAPSPAPAPATGYRVEPNATFEGEVRLPLKGPRDIEELGITVGGLGDDDSAFEFNGQVIDIVPRPPGIANRTGVFALRVGNTSMVPKFEDGERVYVEKRKPAIGDYVVIELKPKEDGGAGKSFIKRLVAVKAGRVTAEQFNPRGFLEFEPHEIKQIFRVIPVSELLGQ